jgi:undecaprenyl-diphosphatase
MPTTLIADKWRRPVIVSAVLGATVVVALAAVVYQGRSTSFDDWAFRKLYDGIGWSLAHFLLDLSLPTASIIAIAVVAAAAGLLRQWQLASLVALGPLLAVMITEFVFKPIVGRSLHPAPVNGSLPLSIRSVFPSGHETTVAATAFVLMIAATQLPVRRGVRVALVTVLAAWLLAAAVGLVRNFWHYPTDTIGAICLSASVVACTALLLDRYGARIGPKLVRAIRVMWRADEQAGAR